VARGFFCGALVVFSTFDGTSFAAIGFLYFFEVIQDGCHFVAGACTSGSE
jgi:hypothetical protein